MLLLGLSHSAIQANTSSLNSFKFVHLDVEDGLISNSIYGIYQDSKGFMWISTPRGLCKYDGYNYSYFRYLPNQSNTLKSNVIRCVVEDANGNLYVATSKGLDKINLKTESIEPPMPIDLAPSDILNNSITTLYIDSKNRLWVATKKSIYIYNSATQEIIEILPEKSEGAGQNCYKNIETIVEDNRQNIWLGSLTDGVVRVSFVKDSSYKTEQFKHNPENQNSISADAIFCSLFDSKGNLWFGTGTNGLNRFNVETKVFEKLGWGIAEDKLSSPTINSLAEDNYGNIWIGHRGNGLDIYEPQSRKIHKLKHSATNHNTIGWDVINWIYKDQNGSMWLGTFGKGIDIWHQSLQNFETYSVNADLEHSIQIESVITIEEDTDKRIWIAGYLGFDIINRKNNEIIHGFEVSNLPGNIIRDFERDKDDPDYIWLALENGPKNLVKMNSKTFNAKVYDLTDFFPNETIHTFVIKDDAKGNLYIGSNYGLSRFNKETEQLVHVDSSLIGQDINSSIQELFIDNLDIVWAGTSQKGLYKLDFVRKTTEHFEEADTVSQISGNSIYAIAKLLDGTILVGTDNGLNKYNPDRNSFELVLNSFDNSYQTVYGILESNDKKVWLSKSSGLLQLDLHTGEKALFNVHNGLQDNDFNPFAYYKSESGELFFGGIHGLNAFYPEKIHINENAPKVVLSDFHIFNKSIPVGELEDGTVILSKTLPNIKTINLDYTQNVISFFFSVLDYEIPEKNSYAYMLEGFEKDWNYVGNRRFAHYTSLPPGNYIFRVKGANCDGVWSTEDASIQLIIKPPFYATWLFRVSFLVVIILLLILIYRIRLQKIRKQKSDLEETVKEKTKELRTANFSLLEKQEEIITQKELLQIKNDELEFHRNNLEELIKNRTIELEKSIIKAEQSDKLKSAFLANMSHEIRTPMNAILGFSNLLDDPVMSEEEKNECISLIKVNGDGLVKLIDDIIDYSQIQSDQLEIKRKTFSIDTMLTDIYRSFLLDTKRINKEHIAFSHTEGLHIVLETDELRLQQVIVNLLSNAFKYTENGKIIFGYTLEDKNIRFFVRDTGIGIPPEHKDLVFKRFGKIENQNTKVFRGVGLGLSISKSIIDKLGGDIWFESEMGKGSTFYFTIPYNSGNYMRKQENKPSGSTNFEGFSVLIAEDEPTNYLFLEKILKRTNISITWASDGVKAIEHFKQAIDNPFDIVLLDIKMPNLNGLETFKLIRREDKEVPVIAQTAYAMVDEVESLKSAGFDAILIKPIIKEKLFFIMQQFLFREKK